MYEVMLRNRVVGYVWPEGNEWHGEHNKTGMSWAGDTAHDAATIVADHHEDYLNDRNRKRQSKWG